jgi:uncharacterized metal-binding protein
LFACSGAADVGELADQAVRLASKKGVGKMFCLAGVGGRVSGIMKSTEAAAKIVAVDGCPLNCARKTLEEAGFADVTHIQLGELGFAKGQSPVTSQALEGVADKIKEALQGS